MKKRRLFVIFLLLAALLLSACGFSGGQSKAEPAIDTPAEPTDAAPSPGEAVEVSAAEPSVTTLSFTERDGSCSGEYTDESGNTCAYFYSLPVVSGGTDYVDAVNAELDRIYETYAAPELRHMASGLSLVTTSMLWRADTYGGITSLIVCLHNNWDNSSYYVYHFTADGEQATNADLFAALDLSGETFAAAAAETLSKHLGTDSYEGKSEEIRAVLEENRERTLSPENCSAELPIFVNSYGTVSFVGRVYTVAGAGYYDHLFYIPPQDGFAAEELTELARDYYTAFYRHRPESVAFETNEDGTVTLQLYDLVNDHNSTCAWYTVSPETGLGEDQAHTRVDLTVQ